MEGVVRTNGGTEAMRKTHLCVDDSIFTTKEEHSLGGVARVRNLLVPERVRDPVEIAVQEVCDAELGADKVLHQQLHALACGVNTTIQRRRS